MATIFKKSHGRIVCRRDLRRLSILGPQKDATRTPWWDNECGKVPTKIISQESKEGDILRKVHVVKHMAEQFDIGRFGGQGPSSPGDLRQQLNRTRPSLLRSVYGCASFSLGRLISNLGEELSTPLSSGVKNAFAEYYNDRLRDVYERFPGDHDLKQVLKQARDAELEMSDILKSNTKEELISACDVSKNISRGALGIVDRID